MGMLSFPPLQDFLEQEPLPWGFPAAPAVGRAPRIPEDEQILRNPRKTWKLRVIPVKNRD